MINKSLLAIFIAVLLPGCNGSGSGFSDYTGVWDVRYNLVLDECQVVLPNVPGFVDQHSMEELDGMIAFDSVSGFVSEVTTSRQVDDSFVASQSIAGDLFGDGSFCEITSSFEYSDPDDDTASSLFSQTITCDDGFSCRSEGIGQAGRQPL